MAKRKYDSRENPLIIVWYDILGIPYGVRPSLSFEYENMTFIEVNSGNPFSFADLLTTGAFKIPFYSMITLLVLFVLLSLAGVLKGKKGRNIVMFNFFFSLIYLLYMFIFDLI